MSYRATLKEPNGRKFTKTANGSDAAALAEITAALAITSGNLLTVTHTAPVVGLTSNTGSYSDATFHFRKGTQNVNVHFEQLANEFAMLDTDGNPTGYVNTSNPLIDAYAAAFGGGGYTLVEARYVK